MTVATVIAMAGSEYVAGAVLLNIILIAKFIAELNTDRARASIKALIGSVPQVALVRGKGGDRTVSLEKCLKFLVCVRVRSIRTRVEHLQVDLETRPIQIHPARNPSLSRSSLAFGFTPLPTVPIPALQMQMSFRQQSEPGPGLRPEAVAFAPGVPVPEVLLSGCRTRDRAFARFWVRLDDEFMSLWAFVDREGVEPTNNHAERVLRREVLWRRRSFGCHSADGCRFVERILTVTQSLRQQARSALKFLGGTTAALHMVIQSIGSEAD